MTSAADPVGEATASFAVADEAALGRLASRLAATLGARMFITLAGDLGAGKTTLVKALAAAVGVDPAGVTSPTFGLIHLHEPPAAEGSDRTPTRIVHADLYRLAAAGELHETGWEDAIAGDAWVLVEWPERAAAALPADRLDVAIEITGPEARRLVFTGRGPAAAAVVRRLADA